MASPVTVEELQTFHKIDRDLYTRLVVNLFCDPIASMQVIALWLWMEQVGHIDLVLNMLALEDTEVKMIAEEALACLYCLASVSPPISTTINNLPMTQRLLGKPISLQFIYENRTQAIVGITKIVNDVCMRAFGDIAQEALVKAAQDFDQLEAGNGVVSEYLRVGDVMVAPAPIFHGPGLVRLLYHPVITAPTPAFPSVWPLDLGVVRQALQQINLGTMESVEKSSRGISNLNPEAEPYNPSTSNEVSQPSSLNTNENDEVQEESNDEIPDNDRTMFLTFSRGYPLTETELHEFFTRIYGDCIQDIIMQQVKPHMQPLFARLILDSPEKMGEILDGRGKVKFTINGKHVWVRRYVVQQGRRPARPEAGPRGGAAEE